MTWGKNIQNASVTFIDFFEQVARDSGCVYLEGMTPIDSNSFYAGTPNSMNQQPYTGQLDPYQQQQMQQQQMQQQFQQQQQQQMQSPPLQQMQMQPLPSMMMGSQQQPVVTMPPPGLDKPNYTEQFNDIFSTPTDMDI